MRVIRGFAPNRRPYGVALALLTILSSTTFAQPPLPTGRNVKLVEEVTIEPRLDQLVPGDLEFRDEHGAVVRLGDYFGDKPILLQLVYLRCPMLCGAQIDGLTRSLTAMKLTAGEDFTVLTVSFDPDEVPALAKQKRENVLHRYDRPAAEKGWHFLTGDAASIRRLTNAVGFRYLRDEETGQFAHAAGLMVLTPEGRIARYLFGVGYVPRDVRLAVTEASAGRIATVTDRVLLFCYLYDPTTGKYGLAIMNLVRAAGLLTVGLLAVSIVWMNRRSARTDPSHPSGTATGSPPSGARSNEGDPDAG